jgi:hypothetical protein
LSRYNSELKFAIQESISCSKEEYIGRCKKYQSMLIKSWDRGLLVKTERKLVLSLWDQK